VIEGGGNSTPISNGYKLRLVYSDGWYIPKQLPAVVTTGVSLGPAVLLVTSLGLIAVGVWLKLQEMQQANAQGWGVLTPSINKSELPEGAYKSIVHSGSYSLTGATRANVLTRVGYFNPAFPEQGIQGYLVHENQLLIERLRSGISYRLDGYDLLLEMEADSIGGTGTKVADLSCLQSSCVLAGGSVFMYPMGGDAVPVRGKDGFTITTGPGGATARNIEGLEITPQAPIPLPEYLPQIAPLAQPIGDPVKAPEADPATNPQPETVPMPEIPLPLPVPKPGPVPNPIPTPRTPTPTDPAGDPVPIPAPTPTPTPKDAHVIGEELFDPGGARANLVSIAQELGRVENKMASVLRSPVQKGNFLDDLINTAALVQLILDILDANASGGVYTLSSPCVVDEEDHRIVSEVEYGGGPVLNRLESKIDSVAQLLQVHKDLAQPGCDGPVPSGNVTVTFTEVV
jgi:hypothetical protein